MRRRRITVALAQGEDEGFPFSCENLWGLDCGEGLFAVENIPFFATGLSTEDLVTADQEGGRLVFRKVIHPSGNSVFRVYLRDPAQLTDLLSELRVLGCDFEITRGRLIAAEVPYDIDIEPVYQLLAAGEKNGTWEFEEAVIRHPRKGDPAGS